VATEAVPLSVNVSVVAFQLAVTPLPSEPFSMPLTNSLSPATALPLALAILIAALDSVVLPGSLILGAPVSSETAEPPCKA